MKDLSTGLGETIRKMSKAEFALDLLDLEPAESLRPPSYICDGLNWLQTYLDRTLREVMVQENGTDFTAGKGAAADGLIIWRLLVMKCSMTMSTSKSQSVCSWTLPEAFFSLRVQGPAKRDL